MIPNWLLRYRFSNSKDTVNTAPIGLASSLPGDVERLRVWDLFKKAPQSPLQRRELAEGRELPRFYPVVKAPPRQASEEGPHKQKTRYSANPPVELPVGWVMDSQEHNRRTYSGSRFVFVFYNRIDECFQETFPSMNSFQYF